MSHAFSDSQDSLRTTVCPPSSLLESRRSLVADEVPTARFPDHVLEKDDEPSDYGHVLSSQSLMNVMDQLSQQHLPPSKAETGDHSFLDDCPLGILSQGHAGDGDAFPEASQQTVALVGEAEGEEGDQREVAQFARECETKSDFNSVIKMLANLSLNNSAAEQMDEIIRFESVLQTSWFQGAELGKVHEEVTEVKRKHCDCPKEVRDVFDRILDDLQKLMLSDDANSIATTV